jgi:uncharacterized membrane protein
MKRTLQLIPRIAAYSLIALIALCISWELWLAPLRTGGSWMALKAVPLFLPLRGILTGHRYTYKWTSLLALLYVCEGSVRFATDPGVSRWYALAELVLAITLFASAVATVRLSRRLPTSSNELPKNQPPKLAD